MNMTGGGGLVTVAPGLQKTPLKRDLQSIFARNQYSAVTP